MEKRKSFPLSLWPIRARDPAGSPLARPAPPPLGPAPRGPARAPTPRDPLPARRSHPGSAAPPCATHLPSPLPSPLARPWRGSGAVRGASSPTPSPPPRGPPLPGAAPSRSPWPWRPSGSARRVPSPSLALGPGAARPWCPRLVRRGAAWLLGAAMTRATPPRRSGPPRAAAPYCLGVRAAPPARLRRAARPWRSASVRPATLARGVRVCGGSAPAPRGRLPARPRCLDA
jgi:hypothetical protein